MNSTLPPADPLVDRLCDVAQQLVYFPVRHHSPACAFLVRQLIHDTQPAAVLIEGPSDFNPHLDELFLPHTLPIAVYSYHRTNTGDRRGAFYPFCEYSPEWTALKQAKQVNAEVQFIDLPWAEVAHLDRTEHRYADGHLRYARFVQQLCERFEVDSFDDLWDKIVEGDLELSLSEYLRRMHSFCYRSREWERKVSESNRQREAYMAAKIREATERHAGKIVVVTGGFHSSGLAARVEGFDCVGIEDSPPPNDDDAAITAWNSKDAGITLTPYTYERLDNLKGYNSGMPSPGFYSQVWESRNADADVAETQVMRPILHKIVRNLRDQQQIASTADVIAVETTARALASIRGREIVWRTDLVDAVSAALVKDETAYDVGSPFMDAVLAVMRGSQQGTLAEGTRRPPLVDEIRQQLKLHDLEPAPIVNTVELDLRDASDLPKSRLLHRLRLLNIDGFHYASGPDLSGRSDLSDLREQWRIAWVPEYEARCAEAARYGQTIEGAVGERLLERATSATPQSQNVSEIVLDAALAKLQVVGETLLEELDSLLATESQFTAVASTLDDLLYLYCFEEAFHTNSNPRIAELLRVAYQRALWLFESLGQFSGSEKDLLRSLETLADSYRRTSAQLNLDPDEFVDTLRRASADTGQLPVSRGAATGMLWAINEAVPDQVIQQMRGLGTAEHLGDFLCGIFALAREEAQRHPGLVRSIDEVIQDFSGDDFQAALPSLRLAFTYFAPREKHYMLSTLFEALNMSDTRPLSNLEVDELTAARALAMEAKVFQTIDQFELRGRIPSEPKEHSTDE